MACSPVPRSAEVAGTPRGPAGRLPGTAAVTLAPAAELQVWVLAASTGGIQAVSRFLALLPPSPRVALVYVQHFVAHQHGQLLKIVARNCAWPVRGIDYGASLRGGWVTVPSPEERFDIDHEGLLGVAGAQGWQAPYRPNIDEVAEQVSGYYGGRAGIIVFSGMGDDGGRGSALISAGGGQVWVQSPASCAAVAMPEAVLRR